MSRSMRGRRWARSFLVVAMAASLLAPGWIVPARAISVPRTLAGTLSWPSQGGHLRATRDPVHAARFLFPATHVEFEWSGDEGTWIKYRTSPAGSWRRATEDHDAGSGDLHYSGALELNRAAQLEWRPVVPAGKSMGDVTLDYVNTLDGPKRTVLIPDVAHAAASTPDIVTRARWGADESLKHTSGGCKRVFHPLQQLFVHHTAGKNFDNHPRSTMRAIYFFHVRSRGWCDIGYNFVIAPDGTIFEGRWARSYKPWEVHDSENGRDEVVTGAHVESFNSGSVGISLMGNYSQVAPSPAMRRSLAELLAWEADRHNLQPKSRHRYRNPETGLRRRLPTIAGHRDAGDTECPGNYVYKNLPDIRRDTATVIAGGKYESALSLTAVQNPASYNDQAAFSGTLTSSETALAGRTISTYMKIEGGEWKSGPTATTAVDGSFGFSLLSKKNLSIVAVYDGEESIWGSDSETVKLRVAPDIEVHPDGGTRDPFGATHYPAGTTTVPLAGSIAPKHVGSTVVLKVFKQQIDGTYLRLEKVQVTIGSGGSFTHAFTVPIDSPSGNYQATARFPGDDDHARSVSLPANFVVDE